MLSYTNINKILNWCTQNIKVAFGSQVSEKVNFNWWGEKSKTYLKSIHGNQTDWSLKAKK